MPVVNVSLSRLSSSLQGFKIDEIIDKLPYLGLDIEGIEQENDIIKIEFNPNRPDFASENGILRALIGLLKLKTGLPNIRKLVKSTIIIDVDEELESVRPIIRGVIAKRSYPLSDKEIAGLISMQEDLHNGIGRKRKKSSIGIHDMDNIIFPIHYSAVSADFSFIPLDSQSESSLSDILADSKIGKEYGHILGDFNKLPLIIDSNKNVLSFPPIINGNLTKVTSDTRNLFIEVTSQNSKSAHDIISILSYELNDMGFELQYVTIDSPFEGEILSPNLENKVIPIESNYVKQILGLDLTYDEIIKCLERSRCSGTMDNGKLRCIIPSYRVDLFHQVDICEEIAIGYGISELTPSYPSIYFSGKKSFQSVLFNDLREILIGLEFIEIINSNIISKKIHTDVFIDSDKISESYLSLGDSKNSEFEILRTSTIPTLLRTLSYNIHEKYPQKLFEIGKTFKVKDSLVKENWVLGVVIAHNTADYSEIKSVLESLIKYCFNLKISTTRFESRYFLFGHSAKIYINEKEMGEVGQIHPRVLENFNMRTLVTAFEIDLSSLIEVIQLRK